MKYYKIDGTESITQISGSTSVVDGIMSGGSAYFSNGWDNTVDWELSMEVMTSGNSGILLYIPTAIISRDSNEVMLAGNNVYRYINQTSTLTSIQSKESNVWYSVIVKCQNNELTLIRDGIFDCTIPLLDLANYSTVSCGVDMWGGTSKIKNIKVKLL